jgi:hypothetical protein
MGFPHVCGRITSKYVLQKRGGGGLGLNCFRAEDNPCFLSMLYNTGPSIPTKYEEFPDQLHDNQFPDQLDNNQSIFQE